MFNMTPENIANFIGKYAYTADKVILTDMCDRLIVESIYDGFIMNCPNQELCRKIIPSATSDYGMLLQRWKSYVANGHGGNKELIELVNEKGYEYIKANFQYSILENYNARVDDHIILERESWWKETLQTKKYGYNSN